MCGWSSPIITPNQNPVAVLVEKLSKPSKMHIGPCDVAHIILHYETHLPFTNMWTVMAITTTNQNPVTVLVAAIKMAPQRLWCHGACTYWQKEPIHHFIKIGYLATILKLYNVFNFFGRIVIFYSPYIWCKFHCKIRLGKWFSTVGSLGTPLGHQREWKYLGHLSVKCTIFFIKNPFFNPYLKTLNTYRLASSRFAFSIIFQSRIT